MLLTDPSIPSRMACLNRYSHHIQEHLGERVFVPALFATHGSRLAKSKGVQMEIRASHLVRTPFRLHHISLAIAYTQHRYPGNKLGPYK